MGLQELSGEENIVNNDHVVIVPFPAQGHVNSCMQLGRKLVKLGFRITFVNTTHNHKRILKSNGILASSVSDPDMKLVEVSDGLPEEHPRLADITAFAKAVSEMGPEIEELLASLLLESPITCIIIDISMACVFERAQKLGIHVAAFSPLSALAFHCIFHASTLMAAGAIPMPLLANPSFPSVNHRDVFLRPPQSAADAAAREVLLEPSLFPAAPKGMKVKDLLTTLLSPSILKTSSVVKLISDRKNPLIGGCVCLLLNTFYEIETATIDAMVGDVNSNIYPIGPLVLRSPSLMSFTHDGDGNIDKDHEPASLAEVKAGLWEEDSKALLWLDARAPKSVLYVSFGSIAQTTVAQILELADGLEQSNHSFLWVIRPDLNEYLTNCNEFSQFSQRIRDRALLVPWVPQVRVLSHPSVGAFLTHCGWNSLMESISAGVAMLGWPFLADQTTNCFYITHVLRIGLEVEFSEEEELGSGEKQYVVGREEVKKKVKKMMAEEGEYPEMDNMRMRCKHLQSDARRAVMKGGSSHDALFRFVKQMKSLGCQ